MSVEDTVQQFQTHLETGLAYPEADRRLQEHGPNVVAESKGPSYIRIFLRQFADFMIILLLAAGVKILFLDNFACRSYKYLSWRLH